MQVFASVLALLILVLLQSPASLAGQTAPAAQGPGTAPSATAVEGSWSATPLVMKGVAAPDGSGQLLEFGAAYTTESFLAFWARTGPSPKEEWVLFSWKDGQLTRVLQRGVEFVAPDSRKVTVRADTPIHVGKRLLYFSPTLPDHIYAWDGEKLVKVLCAGDEFQFRSERYTIKRARVADASPDGKALVYWDAPSQHASGWAVHDGSSFTPLMRRGGELPGMPGVRLDNPRCLGECATTSDETLRLLDDGSVLVSLTAGGGRRNSSRSALFRVFPERTEVMVDEALAGVRMGKVLAATPQAFAMQDGLQNRILFSYAGKQQVGEFNTTGAVESWVFLAPDSPRGLAATVVVGRKGGFKVKIRSHPHLYFWNGEKLSSVPWEDSVGMSTATVSDLLERPAGWDKTDEGAEASGKIAHIRIRAIPGPMGGVSVRLPDLGDKPRTWYVPANSTDGKLQPPPRFPVAEHSITLADVVSSKGDEVLALTEGGLFRLRRAP